MIKSWTVGWSDLALFAIFKIWHIAVDQIYFQKFNSKKYKKLHYEIGVLKQFVQFFLSTITPPYLTGQISPNIKMEKDREGKNQKDFLFFYYNECNSLKEAVSRDLHFYLSIYLLIYLSTVSICLSILLCSYSGSLSCCMLVTTLSLSQSSRHLKEGVYTLLETDMNF